MYHRDIFFKVYNPTNCWDFMELLILWPVIKKEQNKFSPSITLGKQRVIIRINFTVCNSQRQASWRTPKAACLSENDRQPSFHQVFFIITLSLLALWTRLKDTHFFVVLLGEYRVFKCEHSHYGLDVLLEETSGLISSWFPRRKKKSISFFPLMLLLGYEVVVTLWIQSIPVSCFYFLSTAAKWPPKQSTPVLTNGVFEMPRTPPAQVAKWEKVIISRGFWESTKFSSVWQ